MQNITIRQQIDGTALLTKLRAENAEARRNSRRLQSENSRTQCIHRQDDLHCVFLAQDLAAASQDATCGITPTMVAATQLCDDGTGVLRPNGKTIDVYNLSPSAFPAIADGCQIPYLVHRDWKSKRFKIITAGQEQLDCFCQLAQIVREHATLTTEGETALDDLISEKCTTQPEFCPTELTIQFTDLTLSPAFAANTTYQQLRTWMLNNPLPLTGQAGIVDDGQCSLGTDSTSTGIDGSGLGEIISIETSLIDGGNPASSSLTINGTGFGAFLIQLPIPTPITFPIGTLNWTGAGASVFASAEFSVT